MGSQAPPPPGALAAAASLFGHWCDDNISMGVSYADLARCCSVCSWWRDKMLGTHMHKAFYFEDVELYFSHGLFVRTFLM
jgi:hypothetical protein